MLVLKDSICDALPVIHIWQSYLTEKSNEKENGKREKKENPGSRKCEASFFQYCFT